MKKDQDHVAIKVAFSVVNRQRVRFSKNKLYVGVLLCSMFYSLSAIVDFKESGLANVWNQSASCPLASIGF